MPLKQTGLPLNLNILLAVRYSMTVCTIHNLKMEIRKSGDNLGLRVILHGDEPGRETEIMAANKACVIGFSCFFHFECL